MNVFDYFFTYSKDLNKKFILGPIEEVTYKDIYFTSVCLAEYIRMTAGENNNILLISENSSFCIMTYLAIMKSGNACVPLNPLIEKDNLNYIIESVNCRYAFVAGNLKGRYDTPGITVFDETILKEVQDEDVHREPIPPPDFGENRLCQILYTSGSTGYPKGVMLSHKNIISNTDSIIKYLGITSDDIMEVVLPFYYCYGLSLLHTHLKVGGSVVLNNNFIFLGSVLDNLKKYKCTGLAGVPSHFQILLRKSKTFKNTKFPDLKYVTQAGGKLHNVFIEEFVKAFPNKKFFVMYGQTEATARLSYLPPELVLKKLGSIGKGIPDVKLEVYNENDEPVKVGETGEIVAIGDNVMLGYLNDPESNSQTLKNGWLYTGDMAQKDSEGFIYLVARKKEIIKVRGKRVSPKEIEEVILSVPDVIDCTIIGEYDELMGETIKAIVVLTDGTDSIIGRERILRCCSRKLSSYKIPQVFEFKKKIDVTPSGKKTMK